MSNQDRSNLNAFLIIWIGQLASAIGSQMTVFAMTIWLWELTEKATTLSLLFLSNQLPAVIAAIFAGIIVDRGDRKFLMMLGDTVAALGTLMLLILVSTKNLAIFQIYIIMGISSGFAYFQNLSYSSSISTLVSQEHYTRANALRSVKTFAANILAPSLAGILYTYVGFSGILKLDLITFLLAICCLLSVKIPRQKNREKFDSNSKNIWRELIFGFEYLGKHPNLFALLFFLFISNLFESATRVLAPSLILARSGNEVGILASVKAAIGIGGLIGAILLTIWGGLERRIDGVLLGVGLQRMAQIGIGLSRELIIWVVNSFVGAFFFPLKTSSNQAIWLSKIDPEIQGRVFASRYLIAQITTLIGAVIAGPLADRFFEPAMTSPGIVSDLFGGIFGNDVGAGIALEYTMFAVCGLVWVAIGYAIPLLRNIEDVIDR